jgi:hypothetical protein
MKDNDFGKVLRPVRLGVDAIHKRKIVIATASHTII